MSEYLTAGVEIPPACDLCHSRKVKCDRRVPCANCADADVECQRQRRGRSSKKRTIKSLLNPEESIMDFDRHSLAQRKSPAVQSPTTTRSSEIRAVPGQIQADRHNLGPSATSPTKTPHSATSTDGDNYHAVQAIKIIELELNDSSTISRGRQGVLKSALQLVTRIAGSHPDVSDSCIDYQLRPDHAFTIPEAPPRELLFMLLGGPTGSVRIEWPDHISVKSYEDMATALLENEAQNDAQFHERCICIYVKAIFQLYQWSRATENPVLKSELSQSRSSYIAATLREIGKFNLLKAPNILTVQSLISSALLMQHLGRFNQCWVLTSYAARQITSLNYYRIRKVPASSAVEEQIHRVVYWCFYLDRTLSSLLGRPPSLPNLEVSPADMIVLDPPSPYYTLLRTLLDLAQVQGKLHDVSCCDKHVSNSEVLETCQLLESKMQSILLSLQSSREALPKMVQQDWVSVDFCYYAIFVEIHRTRLKSSFSPIVHRETLLFARKSLRAFHALRQHPVESQGFNDPYPSFFTWTLFLYPLSAFFVVFCNIIGTLDHGDYELLREITEKLSVFKHDPHIEKLLNLLQSLEQLCEPLFHEQVGSGFDSEVISPHMRVAAVTPAASGQTADQMSLGEFNPTASFGYKTAESTEPVANAELDFSADWLMWQLFNSQVPAGWLTSGVDPLEF